MDKIKKEDEYMNTIINILKKSNKLTAAWNEAALPPHNDIGSAGSAGKIDKSCIIFAWEHPDVGIMSAKKGFKTVLCPGHKTYFDMAHNNSTYERGICWAATIEVKDIFDWQPLRDFQNEDSFVDEIDKLKTENILNAKDQLEMFPTTKKKRKKHII